MKEVIVTVNPNKLPVNVAVEEFVKRFGFKLLHTYEHIPCFYGQLEMRDMDAAKQIKGVDYIEFNTPYGIKYEE